MKRLVHSFVTISLIVLSLSIAEAMKDKPLVMYLPFEEGQGDTTKDLSGNNPPGKLLAGAKWTKNGKFGNAIKFDGTASYVEFDDNDILDPKKVTFTMWLNMNSFVGNPVLLSHSQNEAGWYIQNTEAGEIWMCLPEPGNDHCIKTANLKMKLGKFQHLAITFDRKKIKYYLDGELLDEIKLDFTIINRAGTLRVGRWGNGCCFTNGIIDEVAIYSAVLTKEEIQLDMEGELLAVDPTAELAITWGFIKQNTGY